MPTAIITINGRRARISGESRELVQAKIDELILNNNATRQTQELPQQEIANKIKARQELNKNMSPIETVSSTYNMMRNLPEPIQKIRNIASFINPTLAPAGAIDVGVALASGLSKMQESIVAEAVLAKRKGENPIIAGVEALSGGKRGEFGDITASYGAPEIVNKVAGLAADIGLGMATGAGIAKAQKHLKSPTKLYSDVAKQGRAFAKSLGIRKATKNVKASTANATIKQFETDIINSADDIFANRNILQFTDEAGAVIESGRAPKNIIEQAQAIEQMKKVTFDEFNDYVVKATGKGITIDENKITKALKDILTSNDVLPNRAEPAIRKIQADLLTGSPITPQKLQTALKNYQSYMRSNAMTGGEAGEIANQVYRPMVEKIRNLIDSSIEKAGLNSKEYFDLRNKYRMYKNIENETKSRMIKDYNMKSVAGGYVDAFALGDIARGAVELAKGNSIGGLSNIAKGTAIKTGKGVLKKLRGADYNLEQLYKSIAKYNKVKPAQAIVPEIMPTTLKQSPQLALPKKEIPPQLALPKEEIKALPNLPTGAQRPQFQAGIKDAIIPANELNSGVIAGQSPEAIERLGRKALPPPQGYKYTAEGKARVVGEPYTPSSFTSKPLIADMTPDEWLNSRTVKAQGQKSKATRTPKAERPLYEEAMKYDSAEEFLGKKITKEDLEGTYINYDKYSDDFIDEGGDMVEGEPYILIEKIFVPEDKRGKGIGKLLIKNAINEIRNSKNKDLPIRLNADPFGATAMEQEELVAYYERLGFRTEPYIDGMSGVVMKYSGETPKATKIKTKSQLTDIFNKAQELKQPKLPYKADVINEGLRIIRQRIKEGKPVNPEWLKKYPHLRKIKKG